MEKSIEFCHFHSENQITHICLLKNCFKFLCIKCIPSHLILHWNKKECPILEEFITVQSRCLSSLRALMTTFQKTSKNIEDFTSFDQNSNDSQDEHFILIDNLKALIIKEIDSHFDKIKSDFHEFQRKEISNILEKKHQLEASFNEIDQLCEDIQNNIKLSENIKSFLSSDLEGSFSNSLKDFEEFLALRKSNNVIKVDEMKINEIKDSIKKCLFVQENTSSEDCDRIKIHHNDYFDHDCKRNYLHFFEEQTKNLYLLNIEDYSNHIKNFSMIEMDIDFVVPDYHRSLALPNGDIFLLGGEMTLMEYKPTINLVFSYDFNKKTLVKKCSMIYERNSFGVLYMNDYIYVFGGFDKNDDPTTMCEKYSLLFDEWSPIAEITEGVTDCCVTKFNNETIYLFGGLKENNEINQTISQYDVNNNKWTHINFVYEDEIQQAGKFSFPYLAGCCQINEEEIAVFGGKDYNLNFSSQILILEIKEIVNVKILEAKTLMFEGCFETTPIIANNHILCLQTISDEVHGESILCKKRIVKIEDNKCLYD